MAYFERRQASPQRVLPLRKQRPTQHLRQALQSWLHCLLRLQQHLTLLHLPYLLHLPHL